MQNIIERSTAKIFSLLLLTVLVFTPTSGVAQEYKMTTPFAPGVAVPDKFDTSIGTLNLHYGYPDDATVGFVAQ
jgi:hypothetical protein